MRRSILLWFVAVVVTLASAVWQRTSGPTYPVRGSVTVGGATVAMKLLRSHGGEGDLPVIIDVGTAPVEGVVAWRRYPTDDAWTMERMERSDGRLAATLPHQPPAGKVEYQVRLRSGGDEAVFPPKPAVARFKGEVPAAVLIPHILAMFVGMLMANRAGLEAVVGGPRLRGYAWAATGLIVVGGFILGPAVQKYAFDAWWTGIPFGWDLTDNKTLFAGVAWLWAVFALRGGRRARVAVAVAALVTLAVFVIPHSVWGSEIDWSGAPSTDGGATAVR